MIRAADGWIAVNLARESDRELVAAVTGRASDDPWAALEAMARVTDAHGLADMAQDVGVPAAALPPTPPPVDRPFTSTSIGPACEPPREPVVVDLSAMWAGPLCAHLLGLTGARVIKVESPARPDGARLGPPAFFDWLHAGHEQRVLDFRSSEFRELLADADVVLEASRPRALQQLGIDAQAQVADGHGKTWVSITGYGRASNRVAFGDDAAVAGGLVALDERGDPVFCADAIADPITGLFAALGAARAIASGGGQMVEVAMRDAVAFVAHPDGDGNGHGHDAGAHRVTGGDGDWIAWHGDDSQPVSPPRAPC